MSSRRPHKNPQAEAEQFRRRAAIGFLGVVVALVGLGAWYFRLQVLQHADYATRSEANRIRPRPVVPARGMIYDRQGRLLAENLPAFRLDITPDKAGDTERVLAELGRLIALSEEELEHFRKERKSGRGFRPITLKLRLSDEEMAAFAVNRWRFPGVEMEPYLTRHYPYGDLFAHVIGYVGRIDEKDLEQLGDGGAALTHIGKTGIERSYEEQLRGKVGYEQIETNVQGRALRTVGRVAATPGADLRLSIDAELQRATVAAFGELEGTAVAMDPRTGQILAMVSLPSYDANLFVNGISHADYRALMDNPSRPQFNRAVLGGVAPGSTLKPFLALAGMDSGIRRPEDRTLSTGMFYLPGTSRGWGDSHRGGHGWTDARKSIADSVNTYYYQLALDMGIARIQEYLTRYGFGQPSGIDLSGEYAGILPTPAWKMKQRQERWYPGDTVNISIGQGDWKVTPLQMVRGTGALADAGQLRHPHLVEARRDRFDAPWAPLPQAAPAAISDRPDHLQVVREGMVMTVHGPGGTARPIGVGIPYHIAGKTGTAQVVSRRGTAAVNPRSLPMHLRHRALFIGYAPAEDPQIAVAVAVEGGGYGGSPAAPIARAIFDARLLGKLPEGLEPIDGVPAAVACAPAAGDCAAVPAAVSAGAAGEGAGVAAAVPADAASIAPAAVPAAVDAAPQRAPAIASDRNTAANGFGSWGRRHAAETAAAAVGGPSPGSAAVGRSPAPAGEASSTAPASPPAPSPRAPVPPAGEDE
ncbi:penicillin-binding protein 2 [Pseudoxanthomonas jiangsuensis]|uniref:penicillin-binding protein 2 n=1 Tax=Pseudoxanthomonas jiangsuensis TaxID=619688 RepID=UPI0013913EF8|nr:penicillin-binding protein 2 [Pseudoxanthomonas jiangsuensis]KAF1699250.1 penicillin-binding protein 2 [Pseudoxanthomonas jiangsuensis]